MTTPLCRHCDGAEHMHHAFETYVVPDGCACDPREWGGNPGKVCTDYVEDDLPAYAGICATCEHQIECHTAKEAYRNDPTFKTVVDAIEAMIHRAEITPAEARGAAVLACIHYEMRNLRSFRVSVGPGGLAALDHAERRIRELRRWIDLEPQASEDKSK